MRGVLLALLILSILSGEALSAEADVSLAQHAFQRGQFGAALQHWEAALSRLSGQTRLDALLQMAAAQRALGRVSPAFATLQEARTLAEQSQDKQRQALVLASLSDTYLLSRQLDMAVRYAMESVDIARQVKSLELLAAALNHLGSALMAQQSYADALEAYREGLTLAKADAALTVTLLINSVYVYLGSDEPRKAIPLHQTALSKTHTLPADHDKLYGLLTLGYQAQRLHERVPEQRGVLIPSAYTAFTEALKLSEVLSDVRAQSPMP
jgi:hypothetical protein